MILQVDLYDWTSWLQRLAVYMDLSTASILECRLTYRVILPGENLNCNSSIANVVFLFSECPRTNHCNSSPETDSEGFHRKVRRTVASKSSLEMSC